jgi:hypothetical protein
MGFFSSGKDLNLKIIPFFKSFFTDLLFLIGICAIIYGFWLIYEPVSYIVGGLLICYMLLPLKKVKKGG